MSNLEEIKETRYPTHEDRAEVGAKAVLQCPDCATQPTSLLDLEKHTKAVHGAEPEKVSE